MNISTSVALLAPIVNCIQLVPQLWKTRKTQSAEDLSLESLCLILFTNLLWFLHGYFIFDVSLLVAGGISIVINTCLLMLYLKYR